MKALLGICLIVVAMFSVCGSNRQQPVLEGDFYIRLVNRNSAVKIVGYRGTDTDVQIPFFLRNLPVVSIAEEAFIGDREDYDIHQSRGVFIEGHQLTSIIIPEGSILEDLLFLIIFS